MVGPTPDNGVSGFDTAMSRWANWMMRGALPITALLIISTGFILQFTVDNLGISTDTSDMLAPDLGFRRTYDDYQKSLPQYTDTMIVVVTGMTPDLARDASSALANRLRGEHELFKTVYVPHGGDFLERHAFLFLDTDELEDLADSLTAVQPFLGKLAREPSMRQLFDLIETAFREDKAGDSLQLGPVLSEIDKAFAADNVGRFYQVSWQQLLQPKSSTIEQHRQLIVLQPRLDYGRLQPAEKAMQAVRRLAAELQLDAAHGIQVRTTGEVALAYEELQSASRGALIAGFLSLILVVVVLSLGLRSWQLIIATAITLLSGLILTAGFATVAIGHLNLISIAFAVLYIGLGVDYAIHLCLRYQELIGQQLSHAAALRGSMRSIGGSLFICTATTATAFYAFVPTSFTGVSELGLIAGTGMVISLVLTLSLLPALLSLMAVIGAGYTRAQADRRISQFLRVSTRHPRSVLWLALSIGIGSLVMLKTLHFDANPISLRDATSESVSAFNELLDSSTTSPWRLSILANNDSQARQLVEQLRVLDVVDDAVTLDRFIPSDQEEKLAIVEDLALLLGPLSPETRQRTIADPAIQIETLQRFSTALARFGKSEQSLAAATDRLHSSLQEFMITMSQQKAADQSKRLLQIEQRLVGSLQTQLDRLNKALTADVITHENLPSELKERWITRDGRHRIDVFPAARLDNDNDLHAFVTEVRVIAANATGAAVFNIESGRVVVVAFSQALLSALGAIAILLLILLRNKRDVMLVLSPMLLAAVITGAGAVAFGISFNFANVIAVPLLLGISVDTGVHIVHRYRTALPAGGDLLGSSTAKAVIVSALTTLCGFGILAFSPHPGAASMGQLLTIGIGATLLCMLIVLPALLYRRAPLTQMP